MKYAAAGVGGTHHGGPYCTTLPTPNTREPNGAEQEEGVGFFVSMRSLERQGRPLADLLVWRNPLTITRMPRGLETNFMQTSTQIAPTVFYQMTGMPRRGEPQSCAKSSRLPGSALHLADVRSEEETCKMHSPPEEKPKGPCTYIGSTWALEYLLYRDFGAQVFPHLGTMDP